MDPIAQKVKHIPRYFFVLAGETPNRDELRPPMQWNNSENAGFSTAKKTWLPVQNNFDVINVEKEQRDSTSLLRTIQRILKIRNEMPAINSGTLEFIERDKLPENVLAYKRKAGNEEILVIMNLGKQKKTIRLPGNFSKILLRLSPEDKIANGDIELNKYGALVLATNDQ